MTEALSTPTDMTALLQAETRSLAAVYEREAYLVYNLALRSCCDEGAAERAAERGVLAAMDDGGDHDAVVRHVAHASLAEAPAAPAPQDEMLRSCAALRPAERAALALETLAELDVAAIAATLDVSDDVAAGLLERAHAQLPDDALAGWLWAAPPGPLWERIYSARYRTVEARLRQAEQEQQQPTVAMTVPVAEPTAAAEVPRTGPSPLARAGRWLGGTLAVAAIGIAATQLAAGAGAGGSSTSPSGASGDGVAVAAAPPSTATPDPTVTAASTTAPAGEIAAPGVKPARPLTAAELDHLRMAELDHLRLYAKRQADKALSPQERLQAAREIERIRRVALRRLGASARREERLRQELAKARAKARENAAKNKADAQAAPQRQTTTPAAPPKQQSSAQPTTTTPAQTNTTQESGCLYNESDGTYVCPDNSGDSSAPTPPSG